MSDSMRIIIQFTELAKVKTSKTWYLREKCHRQGCLKMSLKEAKVGDLKVQGLRLCLPMQGGVGLIPGLVRELRSHRP